ncbi:MAG TPA: CmcI family methyltransferase, partial [Gaiellaceae bacterium]|nr:CmcI family methyltransferase [Gaiellaceae bacterium]
VEHSLGSAEGFNLVSQAWLRAGWDAKYVYSFTWMGRPLIQLPEDVLRLQEVIYAVEPDVVVETGVAHGGSLVLYASLLHAMGRGRVIGVDIEIRTHNREAIERHRLASLITLIEGDSTDPATVGQVRELIEPSERVLVVLDSNHTREHVLDELELYAPLVPPGSYVVAMDGIMETLVGAPRSSDDWSWNNPKAAAEAFVATHPEFEIVEPTFAFNEGAVSRRVTYWPSGFLRRIA